MSEEKTEEPTPTKLAKLRRDGEVATSREVMRMGSLLAVTAMLILWSEEAARRLARWAIAAWSLSFDGGSAAHGMLELCGELILPIVLTAAFGAMVAGVIYTGGVFAPKRVAPKASRFALGQAWKSRLKMQTVIQGGLGLLAALGGCAILVIAASNLAHETVPILEAAQSAQADAIWRAAASPLIVALGGLLGVAALLALTDALQQQRAFLKRNRMSHKEVRDEYKNTEGDPEQKARREEVHRAIIEDDIDLALSDADVVVRNPTRLAIALRYREGTDAAPRVLLTGRGERARRILRRARRLQLPEYSDRRIARRLILLHRDEVIPDELFEAVAIIFRWLRTLDSD